MSAASDKWDDGHEHQVCTAQKPHIESVLSSQSQTQGLKLQVNKTV